MNEQNLLNRIVIDPKIMVGKPVIKGTRLTVHHILGLLAQGMAIEEILQEYQTITKEDVFACLAFAHDALADMTFAPLSV
ncbi:hypothetical protein A3F66_00580 [candidate division TM6 bacterium RIFCSPHIGHO2_12_FULL_32_22]|nr:MAG: hypothetical protein A3F66_00580 [candidate division TM6 bacterium RIFCSPHIGHO2_12_FULL_32_22]